MQNYNNPATEFIAGFWGGVIVTIIVWLIIQGVIIIPTHISVSVR